MSELLRFLMLEDNPDDAELAQFELRKAGMAFTSKVVMTEEDFVQAIRDFSPDLILSDYDLPRYTGALALAEAKRRCPDTPFILVTGAVTEDRAIDILTQGAKDYVLKNRLDQRLVPAVRRALAEAEEHRARKQAEAELREAYRTLEERVKMRTAELEAEVATRKKTEAALRESERRERRRADELTRILDAVPTPVIIVHDADATHMTGNRTADELLQLTRGAEISLSASPDLKPRHFKAFKDGRELKTDELPAQRAARGEQVKEFEFDLVFDDGAIRHVLGYGTPLFDEREQACGAVHVLVDITERKRAEKAMHESERRLVDVLESMPDAFVGFDANLRYTYLNLNAERLQAARREELLGKDVREVYPDPESYKTIRLYERVLAEESPVTATSYHAGFDAWIEVSAFPTPDGVSVFYRDVSEKVKAEAALQTVLSKAEEGDRMLTALMDHVPEGITISDAELNLKMVSRHGQDLLGIHQGMSIEEVTKSWRVYQPDGITPIPTEDLPLVRAVCKGETVNGVELIQANDRDQRLTLLCNAGPIRDAAGNIAGGIVAWRDISDRKKAVEALRRSEGQLQLALSASRAFAWSWDLRDDIVSYSESAKALLGWPDGRSLTPGWQVVHPDDSDSLRKEVERTLADRGQYQIDFRVIRPDTGSIMWLHRRAKVECDPSGQPVRVIGIDTDITERKRAEEALKEANQELEAFSYSVSHDLRAPLRHISGYAGMLREHLGDSTDEATNRYVTGITRAAKNMETLIDDLLAFSRIGRNVLHKKKFRFDDLVAEVVREMENEAKGRDIDWDFGDFPEVYGDPSLLKLALVNLVSNAVKFTGNQQQPRIVIGCKEENGGFVFFVKDNGVGFDMKHVDKLFGVFRRLHTQTEFEGTGIGLANVKRIILRHGGKTWAEGAVGQGATFFFMLPRGE